MLLLRKTISFLSSIPHVRKMLLHQIQIRFSTYVVKGIVSIGMMYGVTRKKQLNASDWDTLASGTRYLSMLTDILEIFNVYDINQKEEKHGM